ncbi:MAG: hypothetical protein JW741_23615 [Sedimentisphaerales bacterium]|nr:hypothetical protein [Sedimentisphaerales bacterium]
MQRGAARRLIRMRLNPELYHQVLVHAAEEGVSLAEIIRRSIRRDLTAGVECACKGETSCLEYPTRK